MKRLLTVVTALSAAVLVGCEKEPKTVEYYLEHHDEMDKMLEECKNKAINPFGDTKEAQDCRAAAEAQTQLFFSLPWEEKRKSILEQHEGASQEGGAAAPAPTESGSANTNAATSPTTNSGSTSPSASTRSNAASTSNSDTGSGSSTTSKENK